MIYVFCLVPSTRSGSEAAFLRARLRLVVLDAKCYPTPVHSSIFVVHLNLGLPGLIIPVDFSIQNPSLQCVKSGDVAKILEFFWFLDSDSRWLSFSFTRLSISSLITLSVQGIISIRL